MDSIMNLIDTTLTESPLELKELRKLRNNLNEDRLEELSIFMYLTHVDGKVCKTVLLEQAKKFETPSDFEVLKKNLGMLYSAKNEIEAKRDYGARFTKC